MAKTNPTTASPDCPECGSQSLDFGPGLDTDIVRCGNCHASLGTVAAWRSIAGERTPLPVPRLSKFLRAMRR